MDNKQYTEQDINKAWQKLSKEKFSNSIIKKQDIMNVIKQESNSTIADLKKKLGYKLNYTIAFMILFIAIMFFNMENVELLYLMAAATAIYAGAFIMMYFQYKKMKPDLHEDNILLTMRTNKKLIDSALNVERIWGMFALPLSFPAGILISRSLNGYSIAETLTDGKMLTIIIIAMVVLVPFLYIITEKMNKSAYGAGLTKLEENIIRMETLS